jgi:hypothetical protein
MSFVAGELGGVFTSRQERFAESAPMQAYRHRQGERGGNGHRVGAKPPSPQRTLMCQTRVIRRARRHIAQCLIGKYDILEPPLRVCIARMKIGMQLLSQAPESNFNLFVGRSRADTKHLIQFVHAEDEPPTRMACPARPSQF